MCGIAGFVSTEEAVESSSVDAVRRMTERMRLRGPDAEGVWTGKGAVLGHRRLAIQDLDARSNQPMATSDGKYCITFNGEIYNFHELRRELEAEGVALRTTSDTEVLLALYAREGERMLPRLRGMFAFAIWDAGSRELFLARDPYGIKPLYYAQTEARGGVCVAGEGDPGVGAGGGAARGGRSRGVLSVGQRAGAVDAVPGGLRAAGRTLDAGARRPRPDAGVLERHPRQLEAGGRAAAGR